MDTATKTTFFLILKSAKTSTGAKKVESFSPAKIHLNLGVKNLTCTAGQLQNQFHEKYGANFVLFSLNYVVNLRCKHTWSIK